jgi:hypothetical protein
VKPARLWSLAVIAGVTISVITMSSPYTYCLDGPAFGRPFAIVRPAHIGSKATIFIGKYNRVPSEISSFGVFGNLVVWGGVAGVGLLLAGRWRRRR